MAIFVRFRPNLLPIDKSIVRTSFRQCIGVSEIQTGERCQNLDFAMVLGRSAQSVLLGSRPLLWPPADFV